MQQQQATLQPYIAGGGERGNTTDSSTSTRPDHLDPASLLMEQPWLEQHLPLRRRRPRPPSRRWAPLRALHPPSPPGATPPGTTAPQRLEATPTPTPGMGQEADDPEWSDDDPAWSDLDGSPHAAPWGHPAAVATASGTPSPPHPPPSPPRASLTVKRTGADLCRPPTPSLSTRIPRDRLPIAEAMR